MVQVQGRRALWGDGESDMSGEQRFYAGAPRRSDIDGRLVAVALFLAFLAFQFELIRWVGGSIEPLALDPETTLVGP